MNKNNISESNIGLGDYTEKLIKIIAPKFAARKDGCMTCKKEKYGSITLEQYSVEA